ncbi:hypothetical protein ACROYT_G005095 [Oculina patagonica]
MAFLKDKNLQLTYAVTSTINQSTMKFMIIPLVALLLGALKVNLADGLLCHSCSSPLSMDDCTEHQKELQCPQVANRCGTMIAHKGDIYAYIKACATENICSNYCKEGVDIKGRQCELSCCEGSLCN